MKSNELLLDGFGRIRETVEEALDSAGGRLLARRPAGNGNSIAWLIWHLSRIEDVQVAEIAGLEPVWTLYEFAGRFALPLPAQDTGHGHSSREVDVVQARPELLLEYYDAVHRQTEEFLEGLSEADLDRIVDTSWDPPVTVGARLVSTLAECLQHVGQAAYAKGLEPEAT